MPSGYPKKFSKLRKQKCRTCEKVKHIRSFWKQKVSKSGYQTECKPCMRARNNGWMRAHVPERRVSNKIAVNKSRREQFEKFMVRSARKRAKMFGLECTITLDDIVVPDYCPVLGIKLVSNAGRGLGHFYKDRSPSLDRVDNERGYTPDNILVVSFKANRIKADATVAELRRIADFYEKRFRANAKNAERSRVSAADLFGQSDVSVPPVQPHQKKQKSQVLVGALG